MTRIAAVSFAGGGIAATAGAISPGPPAVVPPALAHLSLTVGLVLLIIGLIMMIGAPRHHKAIVVLLSAAFGWYAALSLAHASPVTSIIYAAVGTLAGLLLLGIMRLAVVLSSAAVGAMMGAAIWSTLQRPPDFWWLSAAAGFIILGFAASLLYDRLVIFGCTMLGAGAAVIGAAVVLLHAGYAAQVSRLCGPRTQWPLRLAVAVLAVTLLSLLIQLVDTPKQEDSKGE